MEHFSTRLASDQCAETKRNDEGHVKTAFSDRTEANQIPKPLEALLGTAIPRFLSKTYDMVEDPLTNEVVSWSSSNNSFIVWNPPEFSKSLLPKYFKHSNFSSFVRQLNTYRFKKVDPDRWEFASEGFLRGQKHLLRTLHRRKPVGQSQPQQQPGPSSTQGPCVYVGIFGGREAEIELLKRDKNALMQELVRMRQQQQMTQQNMKVVGQRLLLTEQRQQQTISFLAKAMQRSTLFAHLVKQNDSNKHLEGANKRSRSQKQAVKAEKENSTLFSSRGQIIKHQDTDPAQSTLIEILSSLQPPSDDAPSGSLEEILQKLGKECGEPGDEIRTFDSQASFFSKESAVSTGVVGDMQLPMERKDSIASKLQLAGDPV